MTLDYVSLTMVQVIGEFDGTSLPVQPLRDAMQDFSATIYAKLLNPFGDTPPSVPNVGTKGVIIQKNKDDQVQAFWLGSIVAGNYSANSNEASLTKGDSKIAVNNNGINIEHANGGISQDSSGTKIKSNSNFIEIANNGAAISVTEKELPVAMLEVNARENKLITNGATNIRANNDILIQSKNGRIELTGEYSTDNEDYNANLEFKVNSNNITMNANGGPIFVEGGKLVINLSDSKVSHSIPGAGGSTGLEIGIISGDIDVSNRTGSIYINASNASSIGIIQLKNGSLLSPTTIMDTVVEMGINYIMLLQETIPLTLQSSITLQDANIEIAATNGVDITTDQAVTVNALTNIEIDAIIKAAVNAAKIEIISDVQTLLQSVTAIIKANNLKVESSIADINAKMLNITGQVMNMSDMKSIKMGPKNVTATGKGPLCAIIQCPWNGQLHVGEEAIG